MAGIGRAPTSDRSNPKLRLLDPAPPPVSVEFETGLGRAPLGSNVIDQRPAKAHDGIPAREFVARHQPQGASGGAPSGRIRPDAVRRILDDLPVENDGTIDVGRLVARIATAAEGADDYRMDDGDGDY